MPTNRHSVPKATHPLRDHWAQRVLVLCVLALFLGNAIGLYQVILDLVQPDDYPLSLAATIRSWDFVFLAVCGVALSLLLPALSPIAASALFVIVALGVVGLGVALSGIPAVIPVEQSLVTLFAIYLVNIILSYLREARRRQRITEAFGQYVPPELVPVISQQYPAHFSLEGEAREMTVMFCDVHDFTTISAQLEPKQVAQLLNALFTPLTRILHNHSGTIDKYMGDAIMAFWGAPLPDAEHAAHGVMAALDIQEALAELAPCFRRRGWPAITMGIGINTGIMCVGNMGSQFRMAYTVVGDAVNLAARLQQLTRVCNASIIVGEATRKAFPQGVYRELGLVRIRGRSHPVRIYEPYRTVTNGNRAGGRELQPHEPAFKHRIPALEVVKQP